MSEIQEDFSIKLNGIPLLKKFPKFLGFDNTFCQETKLFPEFIFGVHIKDGLIKITPCINDKKCAEILDDRRAYDRLAEFIIYQMINSGTLPFLKNIELKEHECREWVKSDNDSKQIIETKVSEYIKIMFNSFDKTIVGQSVFHNDSQLFNILTYYTPNESPVLGSNILFHDQRNFQVHSRMEHGNYDESYTGKLLSITQEQISEMYDTYSLNPVVLRGLFNSGDSLVLNDMLVKHSAISTSERYIHRDGVMTIDVLNQNSSHYEPEEVNITVCNHLIIPRQEHLLHRKLLGLFISKHIPNILSNKFLAFGERYGIFDKEVKFREELSFYIPNDEQGYKVPINDLQFNIQNYFEFLETLQETHRSNVCGNFNIQNGETSQLFQIRGGKRKRRKISKKKQVKKKLKKTTKKH